MGHVAVRSFMATALVASNAGFGGEVMWDESVHGDLSGDRFAPTDMGTLGTGEFSLIATTVQGDIEYLTFEIPAGFSLDALILVAYDSEDDKSFIGLQEGSVFTEPPDNADVTNLLGWKHFGTADDDVGMDILDDIGQGPGAIGFTPPLPAGHYAWWLMETGPLPATYRMDFIVSPAPSSIALLALAGWPRRRR